MDDNTKSARSSPSARHHIPSRVTATPSSSSEEIRSATVHCGQSRLLLLRATADTTLHQRQVRELLDLAGILHHVICAIERLATSSGTELGR